MGGAETPPHGASPHPCSVWGFRGPTAPWKPPPQNPGPPPALNLQGRHLMGGPRVWGPPRGGWGPPILGAVGEKGTPIALYIYIIYTYRTGWGGGSLAPPGPQKHPNSWGRRGTGIKGERGRPRPASGSPRCAFPGAPHPRGGCAPHRRVPRRRVGRKDPPAPARI